mgnify:CR=1 FL=1
MYYYKIRHNNACVNNYAGKLTFNPVVSKQEIPKKIWMYWEGEFPDFVKKCINNIREKNPDYEVNLLNPENISNYSTIDFNTIQNATPQQRADLLRFDLIYQYNYLLQFYLFQKCMYFLKFF